MAIKKHNIRNLVAELARRFQPWQRRRAARRHALVGPAHLWEMKRNFQIRFLQQMGLQPADYFLDIGCGTLRGGIPLIRYLEVGHYYGIETREKVLEEGWAELREAGLEQKRPILTLTHDMTSLNLGKVFDFIWGFSVLFHMEDPILTSCLRFTAEHLAGEGRFYANVLIGDSEPSRWQEFPVIHRTLAQYTQAAAIYELRVANLGTLKTLGHCSGIADQDNQLMLEFRRA